MTLVVKSILTSPFGIGRSSRHKMVLSWQLGNFGVLHSFEPSLQKSIVVVLSIQVLSLEHFA